MWICLSNVEQKQHLCTNHVQFSHQDSHIASHHFHIHPLYGLHAHVLSPENDNMLRLNINTQTHRYIYIYSYIFAHLHMLTCTTAEYVDRGSVCGTTATRLMLIHYSKCINILGGFSSANRWCEVLWKWFGVYSIVYTALSYVPKGQVFKQVCVPLWCVLLSDDRLVGSTHT